MTQQPDTAFHIAPGGAPPRIPAPAALRVIHDSKETDLAAGLEGVRPNSGAIALGVFGE